MAQWAKRKTGSNRYVPDSGVTDTKLAVLMDDYLTTH